MALPWPESYWDWSSSTMTEHRTWNLEGLNHTAFNRLLNPHGLICFLSRKYQRFLFYHTQMIFLSLLWEISKTQSTWPGSGQQWTPHSELESESPDRSKAIKKYKSLNSVPKYFQETYQFLAIWKPYTFKSKCKKALWTKKYTYCGVLYHNIACVFISHTL